MIATKHHCPNCKCECDCRIVSHQIQCLRCFDVIGNDTRPAGQTFKELGSTFGSYVPGRVELVPVAAPSSAGVRRRSEVL
jgi:hypothetical protein